MKVKKETSCSVLVAALLIRNFYRVELLFFISHSNLSKRKKHYCSVSQRFYHYWEIKDKQIQYDERFHAYGHWSRFSSLEKHWTIFSEYIPSLRKNLTAVLIITHIKESRILCFYKRKRFRESRGFVVLRVFYWISVEIQLQQTNSFLYEMQHLNPLVSDLNLLFPVTFVNTRPPTCPEFQMFSSRFDGDCIFKSSKSMRRFLHQVSFRSLGGIDEFEKN